MRKRKALKMSLYREKKRCKGVVSTAPKSLSDIKSNLPLQYQLDSAGNEFLRYSEFLDGEIEEKLLLVFISDVGKHIIEQSEEIYIDGTFKTCPTGFKQIVFIMGKLPGKEK